VGLVKFAHEGTLHFDARAAREAEDMLWRAIASDSDKGGKNGKRTER
jgi:hypothetical protein